MKMMETTRCYQCGQPGQVAGTVWSGSEYVEYCEDCMKRFADDQYVGMTVRHDDEDDYEKRLHTKYGPRKLVAFDDHSGDMVVFSVPDDGVERMDSMDAREIVHEAFLSREPCPFCGKRNGSTTYYGHMAPTPWVVDCYCGARGPWSRTEMEAIETWNRRASE